MLELNEEDPKYWEMIGKGANIYSCEYTSDEDFFKGEIKINVLKFDKWIDKKNLIAKVHADGAKSIKIDPIDLSYGWFSSKMHAVIAFKAMIEHIQNCLEKELKNLEVEE